LPLAVPVDELNSVHIEDLSVFAISEGSDELVNIVFERKLKLVPIFLTLEEIFAFLVNDKLVSSTLDGEENSVICIRTVDLKIVANQTISHFHVVARESGEVSSIAFWKMVSVIQRLWQVTAFNIWLQPNGLLVGNS
jgi:hypothetical protein